VGVGVCFGFSIEKPLTSDGISVTQSWLLDEKFEVNYNLKMEVLNHNSKKFLS